MTLHDWIDELCDALDIETEIDEGVVLDLARDAAHKVERPAAPIAAYLLGFAAATHGADPDSIEKLAAAATALAEGWGGVKPEPEPEVADLDELDDELVDAD